VATPEWPRPRQRWVDAQTPAAATEQPTLHSADLQQQQHGSRSLLLRVESSGASGIVRQSRRLRRRAAGARAQADGLLIWTTLMAWIPVPLPKHLLPTAFGCERRQREREAPE